MLVGLRGVGKTVLLDHIERRCEERGFVCLKLEAPKRRSLPALLVPGLRAALLQLDRGQAGHVDGKASAGRPAELRLRLQVVCDHPRQGDEFSPKAF